MLARGNESIVDLVLTAYLGKGAEEQGRSLDSTFKKFTLSQIKQFLFSGYDTTSSTVCYIFYVMAIKRDVLLQIRAENASILGTNSSDIASLLDLDPFLLNKLSYTVAVIKEILRMYPAVSSVRAGKPSFFVEESSRSFPTEGFLVWANPQAVHRDPSFWNRPNEFLPDRWLVPPGDPLYPVKGAFRPFEHGPRNCIGQELVMIEIKVIMVMTLQKFDFELAYNDLDQKDCNNAIKMVYGERGYQIDRAQLSYNLPCRIRRARS